MLPLSLLCNLCVSRIILPREEDDSVHQADKVNHQHSNSSACYLCSSKLSEPFKCSAQTREVSVFSPVVGEDFCSSSVTVLTVRKKALVFSGGGFIVTNSCTGEIAFRVDGRGLSSTNKLILMDPLGKPLLTLHRKAFRILHHWYGIHGEACHGQKPIFSVSKSSMFTKNEVAEAFVGSTRGKKHSYYKVLGNYSERHCSIYNGLGTLVAEVKRKFATSDVMLSKDVFNVVVKAGIDQAFMMGLIVILHQMSGEHDSI
ncbi:protein LURP-one-related 5-like [Cryptomeria japonica]|uniref:protein LURP-one-related 5-like n=1 Tax=Cryptomeria japonica TaxID=3369 RepID=UPI0027DA9DC6|nr:protein LURP-one-related 5-like [Cryptomeria japonica]